MKENENKVMETAVDLEKVGDKVVGGAAHIKAAAKELAARKSAAGKYGVEIATVLAEFADGKRKPAAEITEIVRK